MVSWKRYRNVSCPTPKCHIDCIFQLLYPKATPLDSSLHKNVGYLHLSHTLCPSLEQQISVVQASPFSILQSLLRMESDFMDQPPPLTRKSNFLQLCKGYSWNIYKVKIKLASWNLNNIWLLGIFYSPGTWKSCVTQYEHKDTQRSFHVGALHWMHSFTSPLSLLFHTHTNLSFLQSLIRLLPWVVPSSLEDLCMFITDYQ